MFDHKKDNFSEACGLSHEQAKALLTTVKVIYLSSETVGDFLRQAAEMPRVGSAFAIVVHPLDALNLVEEHHEENPNIAEPLTDNPVLAGISHQLIKRFDTKSKAVEWLSTQWDREALAYLLFGAVQTHLEVLKIKIFGGKNGDKKV